MSHITLDHLGSSQTTPAYFVGSGLVATSWISPHHDQQVPVSIPEAELYYWSRKWQLDEAKSVAEIQAGLARRFEDSAGAIRWLLNPDA